MGELKHIGTIESQKHIVKNYVTLCDYDSMC